MEKQNDDKSKNEKLPKSYPAGLTDAELRERLNIYGRIGDIKEQSFDMQRRLNDYKAEVEKIEQNKAKSQIYYAAGERSGLPQTPYRDLDEINKRIDQDTRDAVVMEAKIEYFRNNSLTKTFETAKFPDMENSFNEASKEKPKGKSR